MCMHLADAFIQSDLQAIHFIISMCVPWELNPQPVALLTQCSTTEPQEHKHFKVVNVVTNVFFPHASCVGLCTNIFISMFKRRNTIVVFFKYK